MVECISLTATSSILLGFVFYGVASWHGLALLVSMPVSLSLPVYGTALFGLILVVLGYVLWLHRERLPGSLARQVNSHEKAHPVNASGVTPAPFRAFGGWE